MHIDLSAPLETLERMANTALARLPDIVLASIAFAAFYVAGKFARRAIRRISSKSSRENVGIVLGRLAQLLIVGFGLFFAITLVVPSVNAGSLVELLGISSIGIGFAFKDILQNFLAGILILLNQPFKLHDQIIVGAFEGTVEDIQTRATFIRTYDGRRVVIPNAVIFTEPVMVNTAFPVRRNEIVVGVGYGDDLARAKAVILEAIASVPEVSKDPAPDTVINELAGSTVDIRARWWSAPMKAPLLEVQDRVILAIKNQLTAAGIDLPFPTQQLLLHDQTETSDGDRKKQREGWPAGAAPVPGPRAPVTPPPRP